MAKQKKQPKASDKDAKPEEPQIDDAQTRQRILDAIEAKRKAPWGACVICGDNAWRVGIFSAIPVSFAAAEMGTLAEKIYPMVAIICGNCGNTHFVNLRILGFGEAEEKTGLKFNEPEEPRG